jgi:hypothetical protein
MSAGVGQILDGSWPDPPFRMKFQLTPSPMPSALMASALRLPLRLVVLAVVIGSTTLAVAQSRPADPSRPVAPGRPTPAQMQKLFPDQKRLAISDHQARIAILQAGQRCLAAAGSSEALRTCMKQERDAYQLQRQDHRSAMRALLERNGIALPQERQGDRQGKWGQGRPGKPAAEPSPGAI